MAYAVDKKMLKTFFVQLLTEKANIIKKHLKDIQSDIVICANIGPNMATFKLFHTKEEDSLKLHITFSNLGDRDEQLHQLWLQVNFLLRQYCAHCQNVNPNDQQ